MKTFDLIIIGGGMVGLAIASSLSESKIRIAVIEASSPQEKCTDQVSTRVSALNLSSQTLLNELGVWQKLVQLRATPYANIKVWEKDSFAKIEFSTKNLGLSQLGYIIENSLIQYSLWQQVQQQKNVEILVTTPKSLETTENNAIITLNNGELLSAKLIIGADGANSWVRKQADIPLVFRDYGHHALVCNVETQEDHKNTARQIFADHSILAFLPLHQPNLCSIVWSLPPDQANYLTQCDEHEFNKMLTVAFDNELGLCTVKTARKSIPLTARYARNFAKKRIVLIGDAAHTIHPLAGLGVNLGFQDVVSLVQEIKQNLMLNIDVGEYRYLRHYERYRKTEAIKMLMVMQTLKELFSGKNPIKKLARGIGLNVVNHSDIIKEKLIKEALGI